MFGRNRWGTTRWGSAGVSALYGVASLTATSILAGEVVKVSAASIALTSTGTLSTAFVILASGEVTLTAASILNLDPIRILTVSIPLTAIATLGAEVVRVRPSFAPLTAVGLLTVDGKGILDMEVGLSADSTIAAQGVALGVIVAALQSVGVLSAAPLIRIRYADGALDATGVLVVDGVIIAAISALITAEAALTCVGLSFVTKQLYYSGTLVPGDVLVIDTDTMTVKLNGVNVRVNLTGEFFKLFVGDQEIEYMDYEGSRTALVSIDHKDRWV